MRRCAYCNKPRCKCNYRHSKLGKTVIRAQSMKLDSTAGEMLQTVVDKFSHLPIDMKGSWFVSFTRYDDRKIERNLNALRPSDKISK